MISFTRDEVIDSRQLHQDLILFSGPCSWMTGSVTPNWSTRLRIVWMACCTELVRIWRSTLVFRSQQIGIRSTGQG